MILALAKWRGEQEVKRAASLSVAIAERRPCGHADNHAHVGGQHPQKRLEGDASHHVLVRNLPSIPVITSTKRRHGGDQENSHQRPIDSTKCPAFAWP